MKIKSIINLEGVGGWGLTFWVVLAKVIVVVNDDEKKGNFRKCLPTK